MKVRLIISTFLIFSLFSMFMPESVRAEAQPIYYRGSNYEIWTYPNQMVIWSSASQYVFNGSHWVPYIFEDLYSTEGRYVIRTGLIAAEIYDYYIQLYDVNMTEVRLYDERWEVQKWKTSGPGGWTDLGAQSGSPIYSINEYDQSIELTKTFHSWAGWLNITYVFHVSLKHRVTFTSEIEGNQTFRLQQEWSGIVGAKVKHEQGEQNITSATQINGTYFEFLKGDGTLSVLEDQSSMHQYLVEPVIVDTWAGGMKCNFAFGNWSLASGETLTVDPTTTTVYPSTTYEAYKNEDKTSWSSASQNTDTEFTSGQYTAVAVSDNSYAETGCDADYFSGHHFTFDLDSVGISIGSITNITYQWEGCHSADDPSSEGRLYYYVDSGWIYNQTFVAPDVNRTKSFIENITDYLDADNIFHVSAAMVNYDAEWEVLRTDFMRLIITYTTYPTIGSFSSSDDPVYANSWFNLNCTLEDQGGVDEIKNCTLEISNDVIVAWDNASSTFSINYDPNSYCTLNSSACIEDEVSSTVLTISWRIQLDVSYPHPFSVYVIANNTKIYDVDGLSGSGFSTGLFIFEPETFQEPGAPGGGALRRTPLEELGIPTPLPYEVAPPEAQYGSIGLIVIMGGGTIYYISRGKSTRELWKQNTAPRRKIRSSRKPKTRKIHNKNPSSRRRHSNKKI